MSDRDRLLVVDDERLNIAVLAGVLRDEYEVLVAKNGEKALQLAFSDTPPALVLLDVMMPDMDGYEVCRRLKDDERTRDIPVIFLTALTEVSDELTGLELGAADYITKPFSPPIVKARVRNHLELARARTRLEEQNLKLIEAAQLRDDVDRITRHDLRSPLNVIIAAPQLLMMEQSLSSSQKDLLKSIEHAGYTMLNMINMSLDLFRMEKGSYELEPRPVNLVAAARRIVGDLDSLAARRGVKVVITPEDRPVEAMGEDLLCYSLLANLIKNALEASPEGGTVTLEAIGGTPFSVIAIRNRGAVPETMRHRFFDKYATAGKKGGTGLGTYSARLITETQGGRIELDSSEPDATTVRVFLPGM